MTHDDQQPEQEIIGPEDQPEPQTIAAPQSETRSPLMQAASIVPAGARGVSPATLENQVTYAQMMAKAVSALPAHLRGNVGDCLAIIDMASRAGLSPYMVANKTYQQNGRLAFESQLYHAFLIQSGWIKDAALHSKYDGAGDERTITVWGTLRGETDPRYYKSQPFKDMHPGYVKKTVDGKEITYVKGSPLWTKKPDVQMFYDASRDWGRMFCPIATLGMLDAYEQTETPLGAAGAVEIAASGEGLSQRLAGADKSEGHKPGNGDSELSLIASDAKTEIEPAVETAPKPAKKAKGKPEPKPAPAKAAPKGTPTMAQVKAAADRAEAKSKEKRQADAAVADKAAAEKKVKDRQRQDDADKAAAAEKAAADRADKAKQQTDAPPPVPATIKDCKTAADYQVYAIAWIDAASDPEQVLQRWNDERDARDDLVVRTATRNLLRAKIETKHGV